VITPFAGALPRPGESVSFAATLDHVPNESSVGYKHSTESAQKSGINKKIMPMSNDSSYI
jgi:hypothetical protein